MAIQSFSIFERNRYPYYIVAPEFRQTSAGVRALHYLCHTLNELGFEAYVTSDPSQCSPFLRTPQLTNLVIEHHKLAGSIPIAVYPEVIQGNPLECAVVARWALNQPGHLGGDDTFDESEIVFHYDGVFIRNNPSDRLDIPLVDRRIFNEKTPITDRNGFCYYAAKYLFFQHKIAPQVESNPNGISLTHKIARDHSEIADIFRSTQVFYCYEPTTMVHEASACGCAVAYIDSPYLEKFYDNIKNGPVKFQIISESDVGKIIPTEPTRHDSENFLKLTEKNFNTDIKNFIKKTQNSAQIYAKSFIKNEKIERRHKKSPNLQNNLTKDQHPHKQSSSTIINLKYQDWLAQRIFFASDTKFLNYFPPRRDEAPPSFQLIIQLPANSESDLADTLDSLGSQIHEDWILEVISSSAPPDGVEDVPNLNWHSLGSKNDFKKTVDFLVSTSPCQWLIEIPVGARLDILYLWRLAKEISALPEINALFVDDDCCDREGKRHSPRFKPGSNPAYLQSTDIAGPLCVRKDIWLACGGAGVENGSPWFGQLLGIARKFGWQTIKHIPDVLITYPNIFPSNTESCKLALLDFLKDSGTPGEVIDVTAQSWNIRHSLIAPQPITIAILSQGQQEMISRCLDSIIKITVYPEYEILIVTNQLPDDLLFNQWLHETAEQADIQKIRIVFTHAQANHATRSNRAVEAAKNNFVLLIREEAVIVQDRWLEELVRTLQHTDVAATSPLVHRAGDAKILASGKILGLLGENEAPYLNEADLDEPGYLDYLKVTRDVSALPSACMLVSKGHYQETGGMDEFALGDYHADTDLCLKLRKDGFRLIVQPRASIVFGGDTSPFDLECRLKSSIAKMDATESFLGRWGKTALVDPFWNPNISLSELVPTPETEYRAQWQYLPSDKPKILAHPLANAQGDYRVTSPLRAARKAGLATECVWHQKTSGTVRYFTAPEIARQDPTTLIIQNYIHDSALAVLNGWNSSHSRPFIVYALDDLINDLDKTNPFRKHIPPNARSRLKYALARCDRLVVSTDFLAESYRRFIPDIKVVPNRLVQDIWRPLSGLKRTGKKPRIGWAGGSTHQGDLMLLKEIIEQTRNEADWIFFGMCPEEVRPLLAEYHDLIPFHDYPAYLASLNLDIAVAPLAQTPFNQGKSNLRLLEYGALGIPVVCTDIEPYYNSPACRVANTPNAWITALRERVFDPEAREREGVAMREWVLRHYMQEDHLEEWLKAHLPSQ